MKYEAALVAALDAVGEAHVAAKRAARALRAVEERTDRDSATVEEIDEKFGDDAASEARSRIREPSDAEVQAAREKYRAACTIRDDAVGHLLKVVSPGRPQKPKRR